MFPRQRVDRPSQLRPTGRSRLSIFADGSGPFRLDTLFLDEGFSTLDAETLNVAVEALQVSQEGDRMIAVISHVADLAERLPSRIQVIKGVSGSEVKLEESSSVSITPDLNSARSAASRSRNSVLVREHAIGVFSTRSFMAGSPVVQLHSSGDIQPFVGSGQRRESATPLSVLSESLRSF